MLRTLAFTAALVATSAVFAQNVAVVNNKPIPKAREDAWIEQLKKQGQKDSPELRARIKDQLIQREIFMQEAARRGIAEKADVKFELEVQRQTLLIQAMIREELARNPVTDAQVKEAYDKQKGASAGKEYRARHILVEKEDEAKDVIAQLAKGAKFEELAKKSKDPGSAANGGDLDWARPDGYVKPFADAMVKLEKGKTTEAPVQSQFGWHVIRLDDVRDAQVPPLDQVGPQVKEALQQQRVAAFLDGLKQKAKIQ
jgi:peptidyl-prolyl cis-trans isomerase C